MPEKPDEELTEEERRNLRIYSTRLKEPPDGMSPGVLALLTSLEGNLYQDGDGEWDMTPMIYILDKDLQPLTVIALAIEGGPMEWAPAAKAIVDKAGWKDQIGTLIVVGEAYDRGNLDRKDEIRFLQLVQRDRPTVALVRVRGSGELRWNSNMFGPALDAIESIIS